jgi:hypothetical protein
MENMSEDEILEYLFEKYKIIPNGDECLSEMQDIAKYLETYDQLFTLKDNITKISNKVALENFRCGFKLAVRILKI